MTLAEPRSADPSSPDANLLVVAPPGCGKTELLARRAEALIPFLGPGQRILALTFSNKAKANLRGRLIEVLGTELVRRYVSIHNFHGHAGEIIRAHAGTLRMRSDLEFPEKNTQNKAIDPFLEGLSEYEASELRASLDAQLRKAKQGAYSDEQVLGRLKDLTDLRAFEIEERRQRSDTLFFDDMLRHAQRLLRVPEVSRLYQAHYGALLVDEFQDLSPQQLEIALRSSAPKRTFVGDPLQGIYSWTGARPAFVQQVLRRVCGEPAGLSVSYRSSPRVLALLGAVAEKLGGHPLAAHDPDSWFEGGIAAGASFSTGVEEAAFIRHLAQTIISQQPSATVGVICRSGWRRKPIDAEFTESGTPCTRWELALDSTVVMQIVRRVLDDLGGDASAAALREGVAAAIDASDVDTLSEVADAIGQLEELARSTGSMATAVASIHQVAEADVSIAPGIHLLNAHTGKGQQFDWVVIPGVEDGNVPSFLARSAAEREEEHRVLLVMLSRARHGVVITRAETLISKKNKPYSTTPSPWQNVLRAGLHASSQDVLNHLHRMTLND